ncbi:MarR family winged helix-turn-helix transcriptional regulator, partial [Methylobacterium trifolii]
MPRPPAVEPNPEPTDPLRVWFRFIRLNRRVSAAIGAQLRAIGLSIPQFDVLSTLTEREGLTQQELAARLYVTKGNVSGLIDRLGEAGLVERRPIPGDRRSHALHLTPAGAGLA